MSQPGFTSQPGLTFSNATGGYGNITLFKDPDLCTLKTCDLGLASFSYIPSLAGNALFAAIFAIYFITQIGLGIKFRTWGYMVATFFGLVCIAIRVFAFGSLTRPASCLRSSAMSLELGYTSTLSTMVTS